MARIKSLLKYSRLIDRRTYTLKRSSAEKGVELLVALAISWAVFSQIRAIAVGPLLVRLSVAKLLVLELAAAWVLLPSTAQVSIPVRSLDLYPLTKQQKTIYRIATILQNWRILAIAIVSAFSVAALVRVPHAPVVIPEVLGALLLAASIGIICAISLQSLQIGREREAAISATIEPQQISLLRKELRCYLRPLDFYFCLFISFCAGLSEFFGSWMSPSKALLPFLFIALLMMPLFLNPFGLETRPQLDRYLLTPTPYWRLLREKHLALVLLFLVSTLPLSAALIYQLSFFQVCTMIIETCTIAASCLIVGLLLMQQPRAKQIRVAVGSLSGNISFLFAVQIAVLIALAPLGESLAARYMGYVGSTLIALCIMCSIIAIYLWRLRKQNWPPRQD